MTDDARPPRAGVLVDFSGSERSDSSKEDKSPRLNEVTVAIAAAQLLETR